MKNLLSLAALLLAACASAPAVSVNDVAPKGALRVAIGVGPSASPFWATRDATSGTRLSAHFMALIETGDRSDEFSEYLRLWPRIISKAERERVMQLAQGIKESSPKFHEKLVKALAP